MSFPSNETEIVEEEEGLPVVKTAIYAIIIPCLIVPCIVGNVLTIIAYVKDRKLQTLYNSYLISMAIADLLIGTVSMPFYATYTLTNFKWLFGPGFCKAYLSIDFLACLESVLIIILITYDRCMLLRLGAGYSSQQTMFVVKLKIIASWVLSFLIYVPAIIFWDLIRGFSIIESEDCDVEFYNDSTFTIITAIFEFLLPLLGISSLSIYLYILIRNRSRHRPGNSDKISVVNEKSHHSSSVQTISEKCSTGKSESVKKRSTAKSENAKRENKAAKSLTVIVTVFTICWTPYTICTVIIAFCSDCVHDDVYDAFNWLLWAKSALNPFLYALTNPYFREFFQKMLCPRTQCCRGDKIHPNRG